MNTKELLYHNGFGGFTKDGKEYKISTDEDFTPLPWSHMMANEKFGCLITASGGGYVWSKNSRENKLTRWSNDFVEDPPSEKLWLEEKNEKHDILPYRSLKDFVVTYGFGYASFEKNTEDISMHTLIFVPLDKNKKVYQIVLQNHTNERKELRLKHQVVPVLGVSREETKKHLLIAQNNNIVTIQNYNREDFADEMVYIAASSGIISMEEQDKIVTASIPIILEARKRKRSDYRIWYFFFRGRTRKP